jgi:hypothetical protein
MKAADGPRCFGCDTRLTRSKARTYKRADGTTTEFPALWRGYGTMRDGNLYEEPTLFCSLRCAANFAETLVRAGRRITYDGKTCLGGSRP